MKRKNTFKAAVAGLSVMIAGIPVSAAGLTDCLDAAGQNGIYVITDEASLEQVKEKLKDMGVDLSSGNICGQILPDCSFWQAPGQPETGQPGTGQPETEQPETEQPETEQPETEQPETEQPETEQPETEQPETEQPETEQPETEQPGTEQPGTEQPGTEQPGTEQPGTEEASGQPFVMQVVALVNEERAKENLPALQFDLAISQAALIRAKETEISFSHTRPNGTSFSTVLTENGISYRGCGENIAWGQKTPEQVMEGWMNSPGHRANIMNANYTKIGVGYYQNSNGVNYWTQLFTY